MTSHIFLRIFVSFGLTTVTIVILNCSLLKKILDEAKIILRGIFMYFHATTSLPHGNNCSSRPIVLAQLTEFVDSSISVLPYD